MLVLGLRRRLYGAHGRGLLRILQPASLVPFHAHRKRQFIAFHGLMFSTFMRHLGSIFL